MEENFPGWLPKIGDSNESRKRLNGRRVRRLKSARRLTAMAADSTKVVMDSGYMPAPPRNVIDEVKDSSRQEKRLLPMIKHKQIVNDGLLATKLSSKEQIIFKAAPVKGLLKRKKIQQLVVAPVVDDKLPSINIRYKVKEAPQKIQCNLPTLVKNESAVKTDVREKSSFGNIGCTSLVGKLENPTFEETYKLSSNKKRTLVKNKKVARNAQYSVVMHRKKTPITAILPIEKSKVVVKRVSKQMGRNI